MLNTVKELRAKAVDAAFDQYRSTGDVSMRKVAVALGVTAPALYHHFAAKDDLLNAVAERAFALFEKRLRPVDSREPRKVIRAILDEYRAFAIDEPFFFGLIFISPRPGARRFPRDFADHRSAVFNRLWKGVEESIAASPDGHSDDALYIAHDVWALTHGQILLWRAGRFEDDGTFRRVLDRSIDRFLSTL